ncbi:DUF1573 domain-containing protein [Anditalea andensis]|uniref:DUF1573 domain-containing protein n=1 Tax=Anditalea andensis TaxID=1048983 RepID=A0A074KY06_9BACT|nr:DUF1573 domain-containing protein [Anditalea andensis]KEO73834.1 hypothetical protein EL17_10045 [Anditalea andensis]
MKTNILYTFFIFSLSLMPYLVYAQDIMEQPLIWEKKKIDIGTVMEENGKVSTEYYFVNKANFPVFIDKISTDCGCTTASYTTDTLFQDKIGSVVIDYDPTNRGGAFSKMIIVKTNIDYAGDTLFLEGYNIPYPENVESHYTNLVNDLGFKFNSINMGNVFNNEPRTKYVDFYNFKDIPVTISLRTKLPEHIEVKMNPSIVPAKSRGILEITYDAAIKDDLGFFDENISFYIAKDTEPTHLRLLTTVHEYFDPLPISELNNQPKLAISEVNVNMGSVSANQKVTKSVTLTNSGSEPINIRKVVSNCDCLQYDLPRFDLLPGQKETLRLTLDPKGRQGIDHKTLTIFSNDPLNPTRTILIKSSVK